VIVEDYFLDRDDSNYNGRAGQSVGLELDPNTTYTFRVYVYDDQGENVSGSNGQTDSIGRITVDDINFNVSTQNIVDTDNDGIADSLDIDSDNDGITDNIEAQTTDGYIAPSGVGGTPGFIDVNQDGLDDNYDTRTGITATTTAATVTDGEGLTPVNSDAGATTPDTTADFLDTDADNDGADDAAEAGHGEALITNGTLSDATTDADGDGLFDVFETALDANTNDGYMISVIIGGDVTAVGSQITLASGALLTLNADGTYIYDPNGAFDSLLPGQSGTDTFDYVITDPSGETDTATVTLTILGVNDAPIAVDDTVTGDEQTITSIDLPRRDR